VGFAIFVAVRLHARPTLIIYSQLVYRSKMPSIFSIYGSRNASSNPVVSRIGTFQGLTSGSWICCHHSSYVETHSI
jgi:hypothetical protein